MNRIASNRMLDRLLFMTAKNVAAMVFITMSMYGGFALFILRSGPFQDDVSRLSAVFAASTVWSVFLAYADEIFTMSDALVERFVARFFQEGVR